MFDGVLRLDLMQARSIRSELNIHPKLCLKDDSILNKVYEVAKPRNVPVFCNTGCRHENVREKLKYCDAVCMGTAFKKDGVFNGRVDEERVRSFMEIVYDIRARL